MPRCSCYRGTAGQIDYMSSCYGCLTLDRLNMFYFFPLFNSNIFVYLISNALQFRFQEQFSRRFHYQQVRSVMLHLCTIIQACRKKQTRLAWVIRQLNEVSLQMFNIRRARRYIFYNNTLFLMVMRCYIGFRSNESLIDSLSLYYSILLHKHVGGNKSLPCVTCCHGCVERQ